MIDCMCASKGGAEVPKKRQGQHKQKEQQEKRPATPAFLLELPLVVDAGQAARLRAHLEAARQLYNAILSQGQKRLRRMRSDPAWQEARALPRSQKAERAAAFSALRKAHGFTEAALHEAVKGLRVGWIAEHIEAVLAQTLATRAYRALNRVCLGKAKRVRFKSRGRGLSSIENWQGHRWGRSWSLDPGLLSSGRGGEPGGVLRRTGS